MATLVHEMIHQWQEDHGHPPRRCYHNAEWADKMEAIGLMPVQHRRTRREAHRTTMLPLSLDNGLFRKVFHDMPDEYLMPWRSGTVPEAEIRKKKRQNKIKYECPGCATAVWGKPELRIVCDECSIRFQEMGNYASSSDRAGE